MYFLPPNAVKAAVEAAGGPTKVSNALGVSNSAVHKWVTNQRVPDIDQAKRLAKLSNVAVEKLRPV